MSEGGVNPTEESPSTHLSLKQALRESGVFEIAKEGVHRKKAFRLLKSIVNQWITLRSRQPSTTEGKFFTHGSYSLRVHFKDDDIDVLLVVPVWVSRNHFYCEFPKFLKLNPQVEYAYSLSDYVAPIVKTKVMNIKFDIMIAKIRECQLPTNFQLPESVDYLLWSDMVSICAIDGVQTACYILHGVNSKNIYRTALRAIRLWARRRGIYSNTLGYFNGVSLAIMTFRICQLFPNDSASMIVYHFFRIYSQWSWPEPVRIYYHRIVCNELAGSSGSMPVLTTNNPPQNTLARVIRSGREVMSRELMKGFEKMREIIDVKRPWSDLFETPFFFTYPYYYSATVVCDDEKVFLKLRPRFEGRIRLSLKTFQKLNNVEYLHINCQAFDRGIEDFNVGYIKKWFIGIQLRRPNDFDESVFKGLFSNYEISVKFFHRSMLPRHLPRDVLESIRDRLNEELSEGSSVPRGE